jgi:sec-independent protein translocase protein TatA
MQAGLSERNMIGFRELLVILAIALLVFGAKRLRTIGSDLGAAVKGFKQSMADGDSDEQVKQLKGDADFSAKPSETKASSKTNA